MARICDILQANLSATEADILEVLTALKLSTVLGLSPEIIMVPNGFENEPELERVEERAALLLKNHG